MTTSNCRSGQPPCPPSTLGGQAGAIAVPNATNLSSRASRGHNRTAMVHFCTRCPQIVARHWPDVDAASERARAAGADVVYPLADQFYVERGGRLQDPFGQQWMLATRTELLSPQEMTARMREGG